MSNRGALAELDDDAAIDLIASGVLSKEIAARYGCSSRAVRYRLSRHPQWQQAVKDQATALVETATEYAMNCDADSVPIARVRADIAFKWAAATDPERWGNRTQIDVHVDIGDELQRISQRMQSVVATQHAALLSADSELSTHDDDIQGVD